MQSQSRVCLLWVSPGSPLTARVDQEVPKNTRRFNKFMEIIKGKFLLLFFMVITFGILLKMQNAKCDTCFYARDL